MQISVYFVQAEGDRKPKAPESRRRPKAEGDRKPKDIKIILFFSNISIMGYYNILLFVNNE